MAAEPAESLHYAEPVALDRLIALAGRVLSSEDLYLHSWHAVTQGKKKKKTAESETWPMLPGGSEQQYVLEQMQCAKQQLHCSSF